MIQTAADKRSPSDEEAKGIWASYAADTPSGPTIVCVLAAMFALSLIARAALGAAQRSTAAQEDQRE